MNSESRLWKEIVKRIAASPRTQITFAEYMDMVLYHPQYGYYSQPGINLGKEGDFFTSVHLGADFGEMLAVQFYQMWEVLGQPTPFALVEMGAGQGYLAADILNFIKQDYPDFFAALKYVIVEKSSVLRAVQQQKLADFAVDWCDLEDIPSNSITGCFFSNELVDAFGVHQFVIEAGQLQEVYVGIAEGWGDGENLSSDITVSPRLPLSASASPFVEVIDTPSTPQLVSYFDLVEIDISNYSDGYRSEINLAALDWLSLVADRLGRGYVLTIDYGYPASRYYNSRRHQGTLQCYYQHHRHNDPYINIGQQDITTHVDFTALEKWGDHHGLMKVGLTQQALFLMALGLGTRMAALSDTERSLPELLQRRDALRQLLDPLGVGGFYVLAQSKALSADQTSQPLQGFVEPQ